MSRSENKKGLSGNVGGKGSHVSRSKVKCLRSMVMGFKVGLKVMILADGLTSVSGCFIKVFGVWIATMSTAVWKQAIHPKKWRENFTAIKIEFSCMSL